MTAPQFAATIHVLSARLGDARVAFPAAAVERIVRAVAIAPVAGALPIIEGTINLRGTPVPVLDIRRRLDLPPVELASSQFFVVLQCANRVVAIRVDDVDDILELQRDQLESSESLSPTLQRVLGVAPTDDGTLVVYDVDSFLNDAERAALDVSENAARNNT